MKKYILTALLLINIFYLGSIAHADLIWDPDNPDEIDNNTSLNICISGGAPPFSWTVTGNGLSFASSYTNGSCNLLIAGDAACGAAEITVLDNFGAVTNGIIRGTSGYWQVQGGPYQGECLIPGPPDPDSAFLHGNANGAFRIEGMYKVVTVLSGLGFAYTYPEGCPIPQCIEGFGDWMCDLYNSGMEDYPHINFIGNRDRCEYHYDDGTTQTVNYACFGDGNHVTLYKWVCTNFPPLPVEQLEDSPNLGPGNDDNCLEKQTNPITHNPINFATGNKYIKQIDFTLDGPGIPFQFIRHFNSQSVYNGMLGYGWTNTFSDNLVLDTDKILLYENGGAGVSFIGEGTGIYFSQTDKLRVIEQTASGYQLTEPDGTTMTFETAGRLTEITDRNGNIQTLTYTAGVLTAVEDNYGRRLEFTYDGDGHLTALATPIGNFTYYYDSEDNLTGMINPAATGRSYLYEDANDPHNITGIVNENGIRSSTVVYDAEDRAVSSEKAGGVDRLTVTYNADNSRQLTDTKGSTTTFNLYVDHHIGRIKSSNGPGCGSCPTSTGAQYTHDARLLVTSKTDTLGHVTNYTYDSRGNMLSETQAAGTPQERTITYTYHPTLNLVTTITRESIANPGQTRVIAFSYDENGNLIKRTASGYQDAALISSTSTYGYNALGQLISIDGPRTDTADTTTITYYANGPVECLNRGQLHTIVNTLGQTVTFAQYNAFGCPEQIIDENGVATTYTYDGDGRLTSKSTLGRTTSLSYDPAGNLTFVTLPSGRTITYTYTTADLLETISDNLGNSITFSYDSEGNRIKEKVRDPEGLLTRYVDFDYDDYNRLMNTIYPGGAFDERSYDAGGNLIQLTDANGLDYQYGYDSLDRLSLLTAPDLSSTNIFRNSGDDVTAVRDAEEKLVSYDYDDLGRLVAENSPDSGATTYEYDAAGNLISKTDARGITVTYTYDALNRLTAEQYPNATQNVSYTYDQGTNGIGRLTGRADQSGTYAYTYDAFGNLIEVRKTVSGVVYTTGYTYDQSGILTGISYPQGCSVQYGLDVGGRIRTVTWTKPGENPVILASAVEYLPFGPVNHMTLGNGITVDLTYDQRYQLTGLTHGSTLDLTYSRDNEGNITTIADNLNVANDRTFSYDSQYRLTDATGTFGTISNDYDRVGNRLARTSDTGINETYEYAAGTNRLQKISGSVNKRFAYDPAGNPVLMSGDIVSPVPAADYVANADGQRIMKTVNDAITVFHYDQTGNLIAEAVTEGALKRAYVYLDGLRLATIDIEPSGPEHVYYHHNDHLGAPQRLTDAAGAVVWQADYDPFGKAVVDPASTVVNNFRFPGQYYDEETGLHYNWHRYYDPSTGRYLTPDPIGLEGGINLYLYSGANPINYFDPTGLDVWHIINSKAVAGRGHAGGIVGQGNNFTYHSFGPEHAGRPIDNGQYEEKSFSSLKDAMNYAKGLGYDLYARYPSSIETDEKARQAVRRWAGDKYHGTAHNCQDMVNDMMDAGEYGDLWMDPNWPNMNYLKNLPLSSENGPIR